MGGSSVRLLTTLALIGMTHCDQSAYPQTNVVAPLSQEYADNSVVDNSAYYNTADYTQGTYDYGQYSDTDRTAELIESAITVPMAVTAFLAALFGGIVAPMVTEGFRALGEFEMPDIQFPEIKKKGSKGREFDEPMKPVSSLFKLAAEKMIESALTRLQKHQ